MQVQKFEQIEKYSSVKLTNGIICTRSSLFQMSLTSKDVHVQEKNRQSFLNTKLIVIDGGRGQEKRNAQLAVMGVERNRDIATLMMEVCD